MKPDRDVEEVEEAHVEAQREGSAAALLAGLLILGLLAGSAIFVTYFWPVFEIAAPQLAAAPQANAPTPAVPE